MFMLNPFICHFLKPDYMWEMHLFPVHHLSNPGQVSKLMLADVSQENGNQI